jgi:hypothetical protein
LYEAPVYDDRWHSSLRHWHSCRARLISLNTFEIDGSPDCPLDDVNIAATIRDEFLDCLPTVEVNNSILYIYMRGGKLNEPSPRFWLNGHPPCHYYIDAIKKDNASKVVVMSNVNYPSPCIEKVGGLYEKPKSVWHDLAKLIQAKRIVTSRTTFTPAVMLLSEPKDAFYAFVSKVSMCDWKGHSILNDDYERFGKHRKCKATLEYEMGVLKKWEANQRQVEVMMETKEGCIWEEEEE